MIFIEDTISEPDREKIPSQGLQVFYDRRRWIPHIDPQFPVWDHRGTLWWWDRYVHSATEFPQMGNTWRITSDHLQRGSYMICSWAKLYQVCSVQNCMTPTLCWKITTLQYWSSNKLNPLDYSFCQSILWVNIWNRTTDLVHIYHLGYDQGIWEALP